MRSKFHERTKMLLTTVNSGDGYFLMTYSVGTPPFKIYGVVDMIQNKGVFYYI
jgi:hypothetical protein